MNLSKSIAAFAFLLTLPLAGNNLAIAQTVSQDSRSIDIGTYTEIINATARTSGMSNGGVGTYTSLFGNVPNNSGTVGYLDFFDDGDDLGWTGVAVTPFTANSILVMEARSGNNQYHEVDFTFTPSGGGTASTYNAIRFREATFGGANNFSQLSELQLISGPGIEAGGTFDIDVTSDGANSTGGSHFFGIGSYVAPNIIDVTPGTSAVLDFEADQDHVVAGTVVGQATWSQQNPNVNDTGGPDNAIEGDYVDFIGPNGGNQTVDFEIYNTNAANEFTFDAAIRGGGQITGDEILNLISVDFDGDETTIESLTRTGVLGFGDDFTLAAVPSATFQLPEGFNILRLEATDNFHVDFFRLNVTAPEAQAIPEPSSIAVWALLGCLGAIFARRRWRLAQAR